MTSEYSFSLPELDILTALSTDKLIEILLQQQQLIQQLAGQHISTGVLAAAPDAAMLQRDQPHLLICPEKGTGYTIMMDRGTCWTIGRDLENAVILSDHWMSRHHALLQIMESGEFYIIDLGSRNGTFVNGRRVNVPTAIRHGDLITFGQTNLYFYEHTRPLESTHPLLPNAYPSVDGPVTELLHIRRLISVLVIDIRDFTRLTRQLDEQVLSDLVGTWFRCAGEIIRHHGSWVDKYIGDAVMAVWIHRLEIDAKDIHGPFQALLALNQMTGNLHSAFGLAAPLQIGAGINTGHAMIGNTGSEDRPDYTALGDTVNVAFRLENSTKQLGVDLAIGPTTHQYLQQWFGERLPFQPAAVPLKGYDVPMQVYSCTFDELSQFYQTCLS